MAIPDVCTNYYNFLSHQFIIAMQVRNSTEAVSFIHICFVLCADAGDWTHSVCPCWEEQPDNNNLVSPICVVPFAGTSERVQDPLCVTCNSVSLFVSQRALVIPQSIPCFIADIWAVPPLLLSVRQPHACCNSKLSFRVKHELQRNESIVSTLYGSHGERAKEIGGKHKYLLVYYVYLLFVHVPSCCQDSVTSSDVPNICYL